MQSFETLMKLRVILLKCTQNITAEWRKFPNHYKIQFCRSSCSCICIRYLNSFIRVQVEVQLALTMKDKLWTRDKGQQKPHEIYGPRQANLLLIAYASSEGSGEPAHPRSLARTFAARSYKQWVKRNLQTESQVPGPSEWLGMRS